MDYSNYPGQFILRTSNDVFPEYWQTKSKLPWILAAHNGLPIIDLYSLERVHIGWLLGYPVTSDGLASPPTLKISVNYKALDFADQLERELYMMGGQFVAICCSPRASRIYLVPPTLTTAVYSTKRKLVASSLGLMPDDADDEQELVRVLNIPQDDNWFPFGLTPRRTIRRLLPNHYLDLETWQTKRHWPKPTDIVPTDASHEVVEEIATILKEQVAAIVKTTSPYLSLTAGRDSRVILATARAYLNDITAYTIQSPHYTRDVNTASRIAKRSGIEHRILNFQEPDESEMTRWLERTGHCVAGAVWRNSQTVKLLDDNRPRLGGVCGGITRLAYSQLDEVLSGFLSPGQILDRLGLPTCNRLLKEAQKWLDELPTCNNFTKFDLLAIEQRGGCWAAPQSLGNAVSASFNPFCHRRIIELVLNMDPCYRKQKRLTTDLLQLLWPDLLRYPFNQHLGLQGLKERLNKTPKKLLLKLLPRAA